MDTSEEHIHETARAQKGMKAEYVGIEHLNTGSCPPNWLQGKAKT